MHPISKTWVWGEMTPCASNKWSVAIPIGCRALGQQPGMPCGANAYRLSINADSDVDNAELRAGRTFRAACRPYRAAKYFCPSEASLPNAAFMTGAKAMKGRRSALFGSMATVQVYRVPSPSGAMT